MGPACWWPNRSAWRGPDHPVQIDNRAAEFFSETELKQFRESLAKLFKQISGKNETKHNELWQVGKAPQAKVETISRRDLVAYITQQQKKKNHSDLLLALICDKSIHDDDGAVTKVRGSDGFGQCLGFRPKVVQQQIDFDRVMEVFGADETGGITEDNFIEGFLFVYAVRQLFDLIDTNHNLVVDEKELVGFLERHPRVKAGFYKTFRTQEQSGAGTPHSGSPSSASTSTALLAEASDSSPPPLVRTPSVFKLEQATFPTIFKNGLTFEDFLLAFRGSK